MTYEITLHHLVLSYLVLFLLGIAAGIGIALWSEKVEDVTEDLVKMEHLAEAKERSERP